MNRAVRIVLVAGVVASTSNPPMIASQAPVPVIKVCGLVPKAEVKTLIGGNQFFDAMAPEEEALGTYGSSCNYAGVMIQVMPFQQGAIDAARKRGRPEAVAGVGDEAYLYDNPAGYAELYVKVGARLLTLQRDVDRGKTVADIRPGVIALANALVAKLR
jgi:hypothetical protein